MDEYSKILEKWYELLSRYYKTDVSMKIYLCWKNITFKFSENKHTCQSNESFWNRSYTPKGTGVSI